MVKLEHWLSWQSAAVCVLLAACSSGGGLPPEEPGERVADGPFGTTAPMTPDALAGAAMSALTRCGGGCTSDLDAGREALERGDALGARAIYACADTAEAAYGAGLATLLGVLESERGDRVLADLGLPHMPASDLFGSEGYLSRHAARATGSGELVLTGALSVSVALERIAIEAGGGGLDTTVRSKNREISVSLYGLENASVGSLPLQYACTGQSTGGRVDGGPSLYVTISDRDAARNYDCFTPAGVTSCTEGAGSFELDALGSAEGEAVDIGLSNLRLECLVSDLDWNQVSSEPMLARVSGRISGTVAGDVETSDLHPLLRDGYSVDAIPAATRLRTFLAHAGSLTEDLAQAACFFDKAAEDASVAFELPDALAGTAGVTLQAADAKALATVATLGAAALQLAGSYDGDIALKELVCLASSDEGTCASSEVVTANVNAALQGASVRRDRLHAARVLLEESLRRFQDATSELDATTLIPRNAQTSAGIDLLRELGAAVLLSFEAPTPLPSVAPRTSLDLDRFFTQLPEPGAVSGELIAWEEQCDDFDCWTDRRFDATHATMLWPLGIDFDQEVEWVEPHDGAIEDALEGSVDALRAHFVD